MPRPYLVLLVAALLPAAAFATLPPRRSLRAVPTKHPPVIDGRLDDPVWTTAPAATGFLQQQPDDGRPSHFRTEVHVAYDAENVYVGARLYDPHPEEIRRELVRRDNDSAADTFAVAFDSYHDRRTAYAFFVNASGVQRDLFLFDDTNGDTRWDAVWKSRVAIDDQGWEVELAIPLSQIRFNPQGTTWGVQFMRVVMRAGEVSLWQPIPKTAGKEVSAYGELDGLGGLSAPGYLELTPYVGSTARLYRPEDAADPFHPGQELGFDAGLDLKYGLGPDWTLDATVNPDFGQVEADPAQVNLSDSQLFYSERRPFFLEGLQLFGASQPGQTSLFYSRRIGAAPLGEFDPPTDEAYVDRPTQTRILGAAKVTGRSRSGTSVGLLEAVTAPELERYAGPGVDPGATRRVQPLSNYAVARVRQELAGGDSQVGGIVTAVNRALDAGLAEQLPRAAYAGGLDWDLGLEGKDLYFAGQLYGSEVLGTPAVLEGLQTDFTRYAQRPDAAHLSVNPDARSLGGLSGEGRLGRRGGQDVSWELRAGFTSPFFEVNDLGFQNRADEMHLGARIERRETHPKGSLQDWRLGLDLSGMASTGYDFLDATAVLFGGLVTRDFQPLEASAWISPPAQSDRLLRGGPLAATPAQFGFSASAGTDQRKPLRYWGWVWGGGSELGTGWWGVGSEVIAHPVEALSIDAQLEVSGSTSDAQYVTDYEDPFAEGTFGTRYVFADLAQTNTTLTGRFEWTFSPQLSLQTYVRGTVATGAYGPLKWFVRPQSRSFGAFGTLRPVEDGFEVQAAGSSVTETVEDPNFTFTGLQGNAVMRWEWRPGSTLFLVYQLDCSSLETTDGGFRVGDWGHLCGSEAPEHTLMVKGTWWWSM